MKRSSILRLLKIIVAWFVVLLMSIDSALACRWFSCWKDHRCCACMPVECTESTGQDQVIEQPQVITDDGTSSVVVDDAPVPVAPEIPAEDQPIDEPAEEAVVAEEPIAEEPAEEPAEEAVVAEEPIAEEPAEEAVVAEEPIAESDTPTDLSDLFGDPEEPAEEAIVAEEPIAESDTPTDLSDLFGDPEEPAEEAAEEPADDGGLDDLFGTDEPATEEEPAEGADAADEPAEEAIVAEEQIAEEPAEEPIAESDTPTDLSDLFGDPEEPAEEAAEEPADDAADEDLDDLFGAKRPSEDAKVADGAQPVKLSVESAEPPADPSDAVAERSVDLEVQTNLAADELPAIELPMRKWVDNTGVYATRGRLVEIQDESIRLLKDNGRHSTVLLNRLSRDDREYVNQVIQQQNRGDIGRLAAR